MKKFIMILAVTILSGMLTSCFPLFYGDANYPHGRRYYSNERHEDRRSYQKHRSNRGHNNRGDHNGQRNENSRERN